MQVRGSLFLPKREAKARIRGKLFLPERADFCQNVLIKGWILPAVKSSLLARTLVINVETSYD